MGWKIRTLEPRDVEAARQIFAAGMRSTIIGGLRKAILRKFRLSIRGAIAGSAGLFILGVWGRAGGRGRGGGGRSSACIAGAGLLSLGAIFLTQVFPRFVAERYVYGSLVDDMADPLSRYMRTTHGHSRFFVAVEGEGSDEKVVGTVALEPPVEQHSHLEKMNDDSSIRLMRAVMADEDGDNDDSAGGGNSDTGGKGQGADYTWGREDLELRRMSVVASMRGQGVGHALFDTAKAWCTERGFRRMVLSTSTTQEEACVMYKRLGCELVHTWELLPGLAGIRFFAISSVACAQD